jgi:hypothetical protein
MPLSLLTVPVLGEAVLRSPVPRSAYRMLLGRGLSPAAATTPDELLNVLRLAVGRPGNAKTAASPMHAIDGHQSSLAAATLQHLGLIHATDLDGGFTAWAAADLPVIAAATADHDPSGSQMTRTIMNDLREPAAWPTWFIGRAESAGRMCALQSISHMLFVTGCRRHLPSDRCRYRDLPAPPRWPHAARQFACSQSDPLMRGQ